VDGDPGRSGAFEPRRLRILHVITRLELGGAQRNTLYTVEHLDPERFEVALAWGPGDRLDPEAARLGRVPLYPLEELVRPLRPSRDRAAVVALRRVVREFRPQVVHTHSSKAGVVGRVAAALERVPVVLHSIHGFGFTPLQPVAVRLLFVAVERAMARWTDHFIAVSDANLRVGLELGLFTPDEVTLIRSGIPLGRFRRGSGGAAAVRTRLGLPAAGPLVCSVGNFKPQKAPLDFVRMAAEVARAVPEATFVMAGDGPLKPRAEALSGELGLAGRMVFCGWWDDVPGLLAASSVSVLTSRHEGLPRAAVESLAAGVPVVATAVDGTVEVVRHGVNGFLAPAGEVAALAAGVTTLLVDPVLRDRFARSAPDGLDDFDIDRMVRRQEELYRWLSCRSTC
jgi:glycosyltransferase involved in cell wall biosynthesis